MAILTATVLWRALGQHSGYAFFSFGDVGQAQDRGNGKQQAKSGTWSFTRATRTCVPHCGRPSLTLLDREIPHWAAAVSGMI